VLYVLVVTCLSVCTIRKCFPSTCNKLPIAFARQCCAVKTCCLMNDCNVVARFSDLPTLSHLMSSMRGIPLSYRVHIWYEKTRVAGLQSQSFGHNTSM